MLNSPAGEPSMLSIAKSRRGGEIPAPESIPAGYSRARLETGRNIAVDKLRGNRKPSPITEKQLCLYVEACNDYLEHMDDKDLDIAARQNCLNEIRSYEKKLSDRAWEKETGFAAVDPEALEQELLQVRRLKYLARYGDWFRKGLERVKAIARAQETDGWRLLQPLQWTDIEKKLQQERQDGYNTKVYLRKPLSAYPYHMAVTTAAEKIGLSVQDACACIFQYSARNGEFHNELLEFMKTANYGKIAKVIFEDLIDLPVVIPGEWAEDESAIRAMIVALRDLWFDITDDPDNCGSWVRTEELKKACNDVKKGKKTPVDAGKLSVAIAAAGEREKQELLLVQQMRAGRTMKEEGLWPPAGPSPGKRKASNQLIKLTGSRTKSWNYIEEMQNAVCTQYESVLEKQLQLNAHIKHVRAFIGEEKPPPSSPRDDSQIII